MPMHSDDQLGPHGPKKEEIDASSGYELSDVRVTGIIVFLTALAIFVAVTGVLCYGIGKVINSWMDKQDGPNNKWTKTVDIRQLGNLPNSPDLQNKVAALTQQFPSPRLQSDGGDGGQDLMELHQHEDLLLDNYSRVDGKPGQVRIPIERAMELIAQRGLPVAPAVQKAPGMTGDSEPGVTAPLTTGFARTGYELEQEHAEAERAPHQQ
jgi:hypothetical protein